MEGLGGKIARGFLIMMGCFAGLILPWIILPLGLVYLIPALLVRVGVADHSFTAWRRARNDEPIEDVDKLARRDTVAGGWLTGVSAFSLLVIMPNAFDKEAPPRPVASRSTPAAESGAAPEATAKPTAESVEAKHQAEMREGLISKVPEITSAVAAARKQLDAGDVTAAKKTADATREWLAVYDDVDDWPAEVEAARSQLGVIEEEIDKILNPPLVFGEHGLLITKQQEGDAWPFTVDKGYLRCATAKVSPSVATLTMVVFTTTSGDSYGINGSGSSLYGDVEPIWAKDVELSKQIGGDARISIGPMIQRGLALCNDPEMKGTSAVKDVTAYALQVSQERRRKRRR